MTFAQFRDLAASTLAGACAVAGAVTASSTDLQAVLPPHAAAVLLGAASLLSAVGHAITALRATQIPGPVPAAPAVPASPSTS